MSKPILARGNQLRPSNTPAAPPIDSEFETRWPNLYAYMTQETWPEGGARATSTLLFFVERGELKACISDRDAQRSAFFTGSSFSSLFDTVESALEGGDVDWRQKRLAR